VTPPPSTDQRARTRWQLIAAGFAVATMALAMHRFTVTRIGTWQPGYPQVVVIGTFTPPALIRQLHLLGPLLLVVAFVALAITSARPATSTERRPWRGRIRRVSVGALFLLLVLYSWTVLWVMRVGRHTR